MTTAAPARAPTPRLKAPPSSTATSEPAPASMQPRSPPTAPPASAAAPLASGPRRAGRPGPSDPLSDKTTSSLIRRVLCPQQLPDKAHATPAPIEELLPPLTSRNDVDLQLYALIAIILRDTVQNWYSKITPDEAFVAEIVQIIAHCTRALEQRLRKVDLESLLLDEIPQLLDNHVQAYRAAHNPLFPAPIDVDPREAYHALCPLPSLSPVPKADVPETVATQADNEEAYRQLLVRGVLAILLPTEDLDNACLVALVGQILSELIIGGVVARKVAEPWLIWEGLIILARVIRQKAAAEGEGEPDLRTRPAAGLSTRHGRRRRFSLHGLVWLLLRAGFAAFAFLRFVVATIAMSGSIPSRRRRAAGLDAASRPKSPDSSLKTPSPAPEVWTQPDLVPVAAFSIWSTASNLVELNARMPWVCGALSMVQWVAMTGPGRVAGLDGVLDRLASHSLHARVLDPSQLPPLLRSLRAALFPNNAQGKPTLVAPSSDAELLALRRRCASALWGLVPSRLGRLFFGAALARPPALAPLTRRDTPRSGPTEAAAVTATAVAGAQQKEQQPEQHHNKGDEQAQARARRPATLAPPGAAAATTTTTTDAVAHPLAGGVGTLNTGDNGSTRRATAQSDDEECNRAAPPAQQGTNGGGGSGSVDDDEARILDEIETGILDVFSDVYCNKHLVYSILELVLVRLLPELADQGVGELWEERLS